MLNNISSVARLARAAMRAGRFEEARAAYGFLVAQGSMKHSHHLAYAGCLTKLKDSSSARRHMQEFHKIQPLGLPPKDCEPEPPRILVIRGMDKTKPTLGKQADGSYKPKLRCGHFTPRYLLPNDAPARQRVTFVPGGDIAAQLPPYPNA